MQSRCLVLCGPLLALGACQPDHPAALAAAPAAPRLVAAAARPVPPAAPPVGPASPPKQTPFPDTLRPRLLEVTRWSNRELDSLQAHLDSTAVYGRFAHQEGCFPTVSLADESGVRFFYREAGKPIEWVELNLSAWLSGIYLLPSVEAEKVEIGSHGPTLLLLRAGGGRSDGSETTFYTLLISLAGPPTLVWQSTDEYIEELRPTGTDSLGETTGGNYARASRAVTVRHGLVHVGQVKQEGKFQSTDNTITPITPGCYRYQAGRFRRVAR